MTDIQEMLDNHDMSKDFKDREPLNRDKVHPMVQGYIDAALEEWFYDIHGIAEWTLAQMIRDVRAFWQRHKDQLGELILFEDYTLYDAGYKFWQSRTDGFGGFDMDDNKFAEYLHRSASIWTGFKDLDEINDQLHYVPTPKEDDPDDIEFNFEDEDLTFDFS